MKKIYVGNLPFTATEAQVKELFAPYGHVYSVALVTHPRGELPRGFGYVEIDDDRVEQAVKGLNGHQINGRRLMVNETRERMGDRSPRKPRNSASGRVKADAKTGGVNADGTSGVDKPDGKTDG